MSWSGFERHHLIHYLKEWAADQREREAWKDKDAATYTFTSKVLESAVEQLEAGNKLGPNTGPSREWIAKHDDGGLPVSARNPEVYIPSGDDLAVIERQWPSKPATIDPKDATIVPTKLLIRMIECIRECAMEAEIGHELGGFRVTLLQRYGLTDGSDPAFGPVKYPKPDRGDKVPF